jgi:hypothetical protein
VGKPRIASAPSSKLLQFGLPSRGPGSRVHLGCGHPKSGRCTLVGALVSQNPGMPQYSQQCWESYVSLERPILSCCCHRPLFLNPLPCFHLQGYLLHGYSQGIPLPQLQYIAAGILGFSVFPRPSAHLIKLLTASASFNISLSYTHTHIPIFWTGATAMAHHRDQARFDRAQWRLMVLVPSWVVQTSLYMVLIGISAYLLASTTGKSDETYGTAVASVFQIVHTSVTKYVLMTMPGGNP